MKLFAGLILAFTFVALAWLIWLIVRNARVHKGEAFTVQEDAMLEQRIRASIAAASMKKMNRQPTESELQANLAKMKAQALGSPMSKAELDAMALGLYPSSVPA